MTKNFKPKEFNLSIDKTNGQKKKIVVFHGLCKGCGICLEKCPFKAIKFSQKDLGIYSTPTIEIDLGKCTACGICEINCPDSALKVVKNN